MIDDWTQERLRQLRRSRTLSTHQRTLLLLAGRDARTEEEERTFAVLIKAEKAAARAQKAKAPATRAMNRERQAERKSREQISILKGALTDWAVLEGHDIAELLGALLEFAASGALEDRARWKETGDALIEKRMRTRHALPPSNPVA